MKERLEFDNPKTMDEVITKAHQCYQQTKQKGDGGKIWTDKDGVKFPPVSKGNKTIINKGKYKGQQTINVNINQPKFKFPNESKPIEQSNKSEVETLLEPEYSVWDVEDPTMLTTIHNIKELIKLHRSKKHQH